MDASSHEMLHRATCVHCPGGNGANGRQHIFYAMVELAYQYLLAFLCTLTLRDVSQDHGADPFPADFDLGYRGFNGEFLSILASRGHFPLLGHAARYVGARCEALDVSLVDQAKSSRD